jgi:hypothetical protein
MSYNCRYTWWANTASFHPEENMHAALDTKHMIVAMWTSRDERWRQLKYLYTGTALNLNTQQVATNIWPATVSSNLFLSYYNTREGHARQADNEKKWNP